MTKPKTKGAPAETLEARARRLARLAPKARRVVGDEWFFDNRVECGYLGESLVSLTQSFEGHHDVLDFIEAATPEAVKALALKALAYDALKADYAVEGASKSDATVEAIRKAEAAAKAWEDNR